MRSNETTLKARANELKLHGLLSHWEAVEANDWTPAQALAVYEFIDELRDGIWARYELQLMTLMQEEQITTFTVDDDVMF